MNHPGRGNDQLAMRAERTTAARSQLQRVVSGEEPLTYPKKRRLGVAGIALVVVVAGVGASTLLLHRPVTDSSVVECRTSLRPDDSGQFAAGATPVVTGHIDAAQSKSQTAIQLCKQGWTTGLYNFGVPKPNTTLNYHMVPDATMPPLTTCVAEDGHAVVIPSANPRDCLNLQLSILGNG